MILARGKVILVELDPTLGHEPRRSREIDHLCSDRVDHTEIRPCHGSGHGESRQHLRRRRVSPSS